MEQPMSNEDLWAARLPNGDVRSGTLEQLNEAFRSGHLGESTLVRASRSDNWIKLADVLGGAAVGAASTPVAPPRASAPPQSVAVQPASPQINGSPELWQVRLANGEVRSGTREQLTEALRAGHLDGGVLVLAAGASEWVQLGTVMGRIEPRLAPLVPSAPPPPTVAPQPVAPQRASSPPPSTATPPPPHGGDELWQVRLADGQVRSGTRQQLEEAFRAGHLDEGALVLAAGFHEWVTLGSVCGRRPSGPVPVPVGAAEPTPVEAQPAAPVVAAQQTPVTTLEEAPAAPAQVAPSSPRAEDGEADSQAVWDGDKVWRVTLTGKQLEGAFHAGLINDDALVLAAGTDEWVRLGDVRLAQLAPGMNPLGIRSVVDAATTNGAGPELDAPAASLQEPAS
jgi:hypothetical protein